MESKVTNAKTYKITSLVHQIWEGIIRAKTVPIEILETKAFSLQYPNTPEGLPLTDVEKKQAQQVLLSKLEQQYGSFMKMENIIKVLSRMKKHFKAYGRYNPKFVTIIKNSTRKQKLGVVYKISNKNAPSFSKLNGPLMNIATSTTQIIRAITTGQTVKMSLVEGADFEQFSNEIESYDEYDPKLQIPKLGFSEVRFSSSLNDTVFAQLEGWVSGFFSFMVDAMPIESHGESTEGYLIRRCPLFVKSTVARPATYILEMRITPTLNNILAKKIKEKYKPRLTYDGAFLTLDLGDEQVVGPLSPLWFSVLMDTCNNQGMRGITVPPGSTFELQFGEIVVEKEAGFTSLLEKFKKEKYIIIIGDKGSGKSNLIRTLSLAKNIADIHIEDSDDWGSWLTYILTTTSNASDLEDLPGLITEEQAIKSVGQFYELDEEIRSIYRSYWDTLTEKAVVNFLNAEYDAKGLATKINSYLLDTVLTYITPQIEQKMVAIINAPIVNQRVFERGVKHYMTEKGKTIQISLLHSIMDSAKRSPPCALLKMVSIGNPVSNIALRSLNNDISTVSFLAQNVLYLMYSRMQDSAAQRTSIGMLCKLVDFIPVLDEQMNVIYHHTG